MDTTVFFTQHWTRHLPEGFSTLWTACALVRRCAGVILLCGLSLLCLSARATDLKQLSVQRTADGLFVSAHVNMTLAPSMEDALSRSVPLYFVLQADVVRERWYWTDKRLASVTRTYRLAYQPLSRQWRVSVASGSGHGGSLPYALHRNHDSLEAALASITRLSGWQVMEGNRLDGESDLVLDFRFRLDLALLPRPFQLGMGVQSEWALDLRRRVSVPDLAGPSTVPTELAAQDGPEGMPPATGARTP